MIEKKCLILGGCGFLGLNLGIHLKNKGYKVTVLDCLTNNYINALEILEQNDIDFFYHDALDIRFIINILKDFDFVVNLVTPPIIDDGFINQEILLDTFLLSTQILLQAASKHNVSRVVIASNLHVYGESKPYGSKLKENMNLNPVCPLGSIKSSEEIIAKTLAQAYNQKITILRISECFGHFMKTHMPYSHFMSTAVSCLSGTECILPNDGKDGRDYIYAQDVCKYMEKILSSEQNKLIEIYNLCSSIEFTFLELYEKMNKYYNNNSPSKERMVIYPFVGHIVGNNSKISKKFGKTSNFEKSFISTLDWIKIHFQEQQKLIQSAQETISQN